MRAYIKPLAVLAATLAFALWNGAVMTGHTDRWRAQLEQADALAQAEEWSQAVEVLTDSYTDWSRQARPTSTSLQNTMPWTTPRPCTAGRWAFAATRELTEFRAELADLRDQLRLLAEMERFSVKNVL